SRSTAASTRARIASDTSGWSLSTRETDDMATPAASATSRMLDRPPVRDRILGYDTGSGSSPARRETSDAAALLHLRALPGRRGRVQAPARRDLAGAGDGDQGRRHLE